MHYNILKLSKTKFVAIIKAISEFQSRASVIKDGTEFSVRLSH